MSENNVNGITGADVATTTGIIGATIGIGQYIVNDYVITIAETEGDYGYTMTITRGTETQTVTLYGLTQQQYDAMLGYMEQAQAAAQSAATSSDMASDAATRAETAAGQITGMTAEAVTLAPGSAATATFLDGLLTLGIPAGETGATGAQGDPGPIGETGNGIVSIIKTGTQGNVDIYTITMTDGSTSTFTVTNGENGAVLSVAGKTGAVTLDAGDVSFDDQQTYDDGTVGAGLADLKSDIAKLDDGCKSGENVLVTPIDYSLGDDLKDVDYSSTYRTFKFEDGALHIGYQNTGAYSGSIGTKYTDAGLSATDDVWTTFNRNVKQVVDVKYVISKRNETNNAKIFLRINIKKNDNTTGAVNYELSSANGFISINIDEYLRSSMAAANYGLVAAYSVSGITSQVMSISADGYIHVDCWVYGTYDSNDYPEGINLKEKYNFLKSRIQSVQESTEEVSRKEVIADDTLFIRKNLPSYYVAMPNTPSSYADVSYVDGKIEAVPNGKHFMYFTDSHWDDANDAGNNHTTNIGNAKNSPMLIQYVRQRLNIKNVIFGGDWINALPNATIDGQEVLGKYRANQVLGDFIYNVKSAMGSMLLPVMGNHETNLANYSGDNASDLFYPYSEIQKKEFGQLPSDAVTQYEFEKDRLSDFASGDTLEQLKSFFKLSYKYDDDANSIRYIVLNSGAPEPSNGPITTAFGQNTSVDTMYLQLDWFYEQLKTTPNGYDVVITIHMAGAPFSDTSTTVNFRQFMLAMGLKTKTNKLLYFGSRTSEITEWSPGTIKAFDFRDANDVGRIIVLIGHSHTDGISILDQSTTSCYNYTLTPQNDQSDVTVDQTQVTSGPTPSVSGYTADNAKGCKIPIVWTTCDSLRYADWSTVSQQVPMERGTVTEQAFDVVTFTDDGVEFTRFGAGSNRKIDMTW